MAVTGPSDSEPIVDPLPVGAGDLDGHSMEELADYLDRGRTPLDPSIESSPRCRIALDGLIRLRDAYRSLIDSDATATDLQHDDWVAGILAQIDREAHAGRDARFRHPDPAAHLAITEGAIRSLIRAAGDATDALLIGRVRLDGDVETPGAAVAVHVDARVLPGRPIPSAAERLRAAAAAELARHTHLQVDRIDITVTDLQLPTSRARP